MNDSTTLPDGFKSSQDVQVYLKDYLGVELPEGTLRRWASEGIISAPDEWKSLGYYGSSCHWPFETVVQAAGVYALRAGRKTPRTTIIKKVQEVAFEMYKHPIVLLSLPDDTLDEDDPPLETVTFALDCPLMVEPFLFPYIIATEKACHNVHLSKAAVVSFEWAESVRGLYTAEEREKMPKKVERFADFRELIRVSIDEAPNGKDELRFIVGGKDIRERFLEMRRVDQKLSIRHGEQFKALAGGVMKRCIWPLASNPIPLEDETWHEVSQKYKNGELSERERLSRLRVAYSPEELSE